MLCFTVHEEAGEVLCAYYDEEDCRFAYVYTYSDNNTLIVRAQEERECPPEIHVLGMYLSPTCKYHMTLIYGAR
jgi:protocadherin alpha